MVGSPAIGNVHNRAGILEVKARQAHAQAP